MSWSGPTAGTGPSEPPPPGWALEVLIDGRQRRRGPGQRGRPESVGWASAPGPRGAPSSTSGSWSRTTPATATAIAAYVAKYATKTADGTPWLAHPIRSRPQLERLDLRPHIVRLVREAWALGRRKELRSLRLRAHAHTLGYTGQFSSKSLRFSTTFGALREARVARTSRGCREERIRLRRGVALRRPGLRPPRVQPGGRNAPRGHRTGLRSSFHSTSTTSSTTP